MRDIIASAAHFPSHARKLIYSRVLKRGGWVQMAEIYLQFQSDSGLLEDTALRQWSAAYLSSLEISERAQGKKDRHAPKRLDSMMTAAGFVDIRVEIINVPMSPWPEGETWPVRWP